MALVVAMRFIDSGVTSIYSALRTRINYLRIVKRRALPHAGYIDGAFVEGRGRPITVENPSDESIVSVVVGLSIDQFELAVRAARQAFDDGRWSSLSHKERAQIMRAFGPALRRHTRRLMELAVNEAGCPLSSTVMHEQVHAPLRMTEEIIDRFLALPEVTRNPLPVHERVTPDGVVQSLGRHVPVGVVAAVSAYHAPFCNAHRKIIRALITGNTVILRPNPLTPLSAMIFAEAAAEARLPDGVLNVVCEYGPAGAQMLMVDERVDMVSFTGSRAVGAKVMLLAASSLKRVVLDVGGRSAQIFLPDAVEKAAACARTVCTSHASHGAPLSTRMIVPEQSKGQLLEQMADLLGKVRVGPASDPSTQLGPLISVGQRARCEMFAQVAVNQGARIVAGGKRPAHLKKGFFFEPTLLDLPDNSDPAFQEEILGPVIAVLGYRDLDHAVAMANASAFGHSGYVHGADRVTALNVGLRIRSSSVYIDDGLSGPNAAWGDPCLSVNENSVDEIRDFQLLTTLNMGVHNVRTA
jgi:aldehyde dehydrogenase (NAD+)